MKSRLAIKCLLIAVSMFIVSCDKGKKPYEEAEALLNRSDYSGAKAKAIEVVQNAPKSKYLTQAKTLYLKVENIENLFNAAAEALQAGDYKKAIKDYEGILDLESKSPKAQDGLRDVKAKYKEAQLRAANEYVERGAYEKGIELYKELLSVTPNDPEAGQALSTAETTLSRLKSIGDEAMMEFRIYIQARGTRNSDRAEVARVKYLRLSGQLYKLPGGRKYLASKLKEFLFEVEKEIDRFAKIVDEYEKAAASNAYNRKVLAHEAYNNALIKFTRKYGQPEAWLDSSCHRADGADWLGQCKLKEIKNKTVDQWM